jgi:CRP-like cAMP-binding protein
MYFLESGSADAFVRDVSVFSYLEPGKHFGELALLTDEPRKATIRAGANLLNESMKSLLTLPK